MFGEFEKKPECDVVGKRKDKNISFCPDLENFERLNLNVKNSDEDVKNSKDLKHYKQFTENFEKIVQITEPNAKNCAEFCVNTEKAKDNEVLSTSEHDVEVPLINTQQDSSVSLEDRIVEHIAKNEQIVLQSQQRYEPDLTYEQRRNKCTEILQNKPAYFLYRFGRHLSREHLQYFLKFSKNYEIKYYISQIQKQLNESTKRIDERNKRFAALQKLKSSDYFSESEMRNRNPNLYGDIVGDFDFDDAGTSHRSNTFSEYLLNQLDRNEVRDDENFERKNQQQFDEEFDSESDLSETEENEHSDGEKDLLKQEFQSTIHSKFICGNDHQFDYSQMESNYDDEVLKFKSRDLEEIYFDDEEPMTVEKEPMTVEKEMS